ncbi:MAG: Sfum_1244 family protein, partial [bacterium]
MDIEAVAERVKYNCNVSDAGGWGYYSICGLLMRMRDLYRHEHSMKPWQPLGDEALDWVAEREALWDELGDKEPGEIVLNGKSHSPFDVEGINAILTKHGYVYGGGFGMFNKPTFFLARLREKSEVEGFTVYFVGEEIVRDISASPAMLQDRTIFIRHEPMQAILWDKFLHLKGRKFGGALKEAFSLYGISGAEEPSETLFEKFGEISSDISALLIRHELGEVVENDDAWLE